MNIEKGDFVTRKSHNNDIIFKVISISEDTVYLKGVYDRLYADSDIFDLVKTDEKPNLENTEYTENEKEGNFELRYIPLSNVENILNANAEEYGDKKGIAREMIDLFDVYKTIINE